MDASLAINMQTIADAIWYVEPQTAAWMLQIVNLSSQAPQPPGTPEVAIADGVATVAVSGVLQPGGRNNAMFGGTDTDRLQSTLEDLRTNESVDAVLLDVDSPGGSAMGMQELHDSVAQLAAEKPVVTQVGRLGTSAAYYLAAPSEKIYASSSSSIVGSIGTRMLLFDTSEMYEKMGVKAVAIDTGPYKSLGAAGLPITDEQVNHLQGIVDQLQDRFTAAVAAGRELVGEQLDSVIDGRSWLAETGQEMGLVDGIQSREKTLSELTSQVMRRDDMATEKVAATLTELKVIPGVTNDFIVEAQEHGWTYDQASSTWMERQQKENERLAVEARLAADKVAQQEAELKAKQDAQDEDSRLADNVSDDEHRSAPTDGIAAWEEAIELMCKSQDMKRKEAISKLVVEKPELHVAYIEAYTDKHGVPSDVYQMQHSRKR